VSVFTAIQLTTKHDDYPLMEIQAFFKIRSINFVFMSRRERIYWICQITGWGVFGAGNILNVALQGRLVWEIPASSAIMIILGIVISHIFRGLIRASGFVNAPIWKQLLLVLPAAIAMSLIFAFTYGGLHDIIFDHGEKIIDFSKPALWIYVLNFSVLFVVWVVFYFAFHYFENLQKAEIRNLELRAANVEVELNNLRSQLRPHFMFNSLNSIRALIDEDPLRAKEAVTILSSVLRNSLLLGKQSLIPLREELDLVQKYLEMEQIRFEERLELKIDVAADTLECSVPPLMIQTLVENGIKHGVAATRGGGMLQLSTRLNDKLEIEIRNTGKINQREDVGTGLQNTHKRLELIYQDRACFEIYEGRDEVVCKLIIPQK
jgi:two-component system, LytTR family, sensor kinase